MRGVSNKFGEATRLLTEAGITSLLRAIQGYFVYHLVSKWHFVYLEFALEQPLLSLQGGEGITVRIASTDDLARIQSDIFPLLEGHLSYDKRYFRLLDQPNIKCFLAEKDNKVIHYGWLFMDAIDSPLMDVPFDKTKLQKGNAYIGPFFTSPNVRRGGISLHVHLMILHYLKDNTDVRRLLVLVQGKNPSAVSFYKRLGFKEIIDAQPKSVFSFLWRRLRGQVAGG
jgi:GNAT superfamily N-acetyltransferase